MTAAAMTYTSLVEDVTNYAENSSSTFVDQIARFIMMAENRIAAEARGLGLMNVVTDNLTLHDPSLAKPARWRETYSFSIGTGAAHNTRKYLLDRSYEFARTYWPDDSSYDEPKYYADWDYNHWLIVPVTDYAYPFECIYHERPQPLDDTHQTNWTTEYAPQLILYATLLEAQPFLKRDDRMKLFKEEYERALKQVEYEQKRRMMDRSMSTQNA